MAWTIESMTWQTEKQKNKNRKLNLYEINFTKIIYKKYPNKLTILKPFADNDSKNLTCNLYTSP